MPFGTSLHSHHGIILQPQPVQYTEWTGCDACFEMHSNSTLPSILHMCIELQDINEFLTNELKARSVATTQVGMQQMQYDSAIRQQLAPGQLVPSTLRACTGSKTPDCLTLTYFLQCL